MRCFFLALLVLSAFGCHSNITVESTAFEGRSALVWIYADGELSAIWGADLDGGRLVPAPPPMAYEEEIELLALTFACPLAETGLTLGPQKLLEFPEYDDARTPAPRQILVSKISDRAQTEWRAISELDPRMRDTLSLLDLPPDNVCSHYTVPYRRFAETRIDAQPESQLVFAQPIDDRRILLGTEVGQLYQISDDGNYREITDLGLPESPQALRFRAAYRDGEDRIWLYSIDGRIARGTVDGGFEMLPQVSTATGANVALAGSAAGAPFELFAVTSARKLARFDGEEWRTVYTGFEPPVCNIGLFGRVLMPVTATWVAPGEAVVNGAGEPINTVLRYRDDRAFEEPFPNSAGQPASVIDTDLGTYAGTCEGDLVRRVERTWEPAFPRRANSSLPIVTMVRSGAGFLYPGMVGLRDPRLSAYHPSIGYCDLGPLENFGLFMVRAGRTIFLVYLRLRRDPIRVILFEEGDAPCFAAEG